MRELGAGLGAQLSEAPLELPELLAPPSGRQVDDVRIAEHLGNLTRSMPRVRTAQKVACEGRGNAAVPVHRNVTAAARSVADGVYDVFPARAVNTWVSQACGMEIEHSASHRDMGSGCRDALFCPRWFPSLESPSLRGVLCGFRVHLGIIATVFNHLGSACRSRRGST